MPNFQPFREDNEQKIQEVWNAFLELYPDEESVIERLFRKEGLACYKCGHQLAKQKETPRLYICPNCKRRVWPTSSTFLKKKKKPRAWLAGIFFKEHGVSTGAPRFANLLEIAPSSARNIFVQLRIVMNDYLSTASHQAYSGLFLKIFTRRSKESPRIQAPSAEQQAYEDDLFAATSTQNTTTDDVPSGDTTPSGLDFRSETQTNATMSSSCTVDSNEELSKLEEAVFAALSTTPQHLESICQATGINPSQVLSILTLLELKGLIQNLEGNLYLISKTAQLLNIKDNGQSESTPGLPLHMYQLIEEFQLFVRQIFHGISRRYLQLYLAEYWIHLTDRWKNGGLLKICLSRGNLRPSQEISPTHLNVMVPQPDQIFLTPPLR